MNKGGYPSPDPSKTHEVAHRFFQERTPSAPHGRDCALPITIVEQEIPFFALVLGLWFNKPVTLQYQGRGEFRVRLAGTSSFKISACTPRHPPVKDYTKSVLCCRRILSSGDDAAYVTCSS